QLALHQRTIAEARYADICVEIAIERAVDEWARPVVVAARGAVVAGVDLPLLNPGCGVERVPEPISTADVHDAVDDCSRRADTGGGRRLAHCAGRDAQECLPLL